MLTKITKGQPDWDTTINRNFAMLDSVSAIKASHEEFGYQLISLRIATNVFFYLAAIDKTHKEFDRFTKVFPAGTIPIGYRPTTETMLCAEHAYGMFNGQEVGFENGFMLVEPDGSVWNSNFILPSVSQKNPENSWVNCRGLGCCLDDMPKQ